MTPRPIETRPYRFLPDRRRLLTGDELEAARASAPIPDEALPVFAIEWNETARWAGVIYASELAAPAPTAPMVRIDENRWLLVWRLAVQRSDGAGPVFEQFMTTYGPRVSVGADPDSDSPGDVAAVYRVGLRLAGIYTRNAVGPEPLSRDAARDELITAAKSVITAGEKVQRSTLAGQLCVTVDTIDRRLQRAEWRIRDVQRHPKLLDPK